MPWKRYSSKPQLLYNDVKNDFQIGGHFYNVVFILFALFTLIVSVLVFYLPWQRQLKLDEDRQELERMRLQQEYNLEISRMVISSLGRDNSKEQDALAELVLTLPNRKIRTGLGAALGTSDDSDVQIKAAKIKKSAKPVPTSTTRPASKPVAARQPAKPKKNVQILYCSGQKAAENLQIATQARTILNSIRGREFAGLSVGTIIRPKAMPLDRAAFISAGQIQGIMDIRADYNDYAEQALAASLVDFLASKGLRFRVQQSGGGTSGKPSKASVAVVICS